MGVRTDQRNPQQVLRRFRYLSETVQQFLPHVVAFLLVLDPRDPLIDVQLLHFIDDVRGRDIGVRLQIDTRIEIFDRGNPLEILHRLIQHLAVQVIPYRLHVAVLLCAKQISRSPDLQVAHGNLKAAAKLRKLLDRSQSFLRDLLEHLVSFIH